MNLKICNDSSEVSSGPVGTLCDEQRREIYITGMVDLDMYQNAVAAIKHLDQTMGDIVLVINTCGGNASAGQSIADAIKLTKNRVVAHCYGECMSIGMTILQACDVRLSAPGCRFMVHDVRWEMSQVSLSEAEKYLEEFKAINARYYEVLLERSSLTFNEISVLCKRETYMSAAVAAGFGFLDGILTPPVKKAKRCLKAA